MEQQRLCYCTDCGTRIGTMPEAVIDLDQVDFDVCDGCREKRTKDYKPTQAELRSKLGKEFDDFEKQQGGG